MLGLVLVRRLIGTHKKEELHLQPIKMSQEFLQKHIATPRPQHLKRSWKERFVFYVRRMSSIPFVLLIELYDFFRIFWLLWVCWTIIFFVFINWILNLLISAILKKY